jgi:hypothetical protein
MAALPERLRDLEGKLARAKEEKKQVLPYSFTRYVYWLELTRLNLSAPSKFVVGTKFVGRAGSKIPASMQWVVYSNLDHGANGNLLFSKLNSASSSSR